MYSVQRTRQTKKQNTSL